jgi:TolA-binding protein
MDDPPGKSAETPAASDPQPAPAQAPPAKEPPAEQARRDPGPIEEPPRPATVEEVRAIRRWLLVTGVWAVAATAIAAIALVVANRFDEEELNTRTARQIRAVQARLEDRIEDLESRIDQLPTSDDVSDLDNRLSEVEDRTGTATDRLKSLSGRLDGLEERVETLEQAEETSTTQTETDTNP